MQKITLPLVAISYVLRERDPNAILWELMDWDSPEHVWRRWMAASKERKAK